MTGYDLEKPGDREDRRKHFELIAAVIGRMANASSQAKGWSITLAGAAFGVAVIRDNSLLILLGIAGLVAFAVIDVRYLHLEKSFRDLHDAVLENTVPPMSMDTGSLPNRSRNKTYVSWSIVWFYGPLVLAGILLFVYSLFHMKGPEEKPGVSVSIPPTTVTVSVPISPSPTMPPANVPPPALGPPPVSSTDVPPPLTDTTKQPAE